MADEEKESQKLNPKPSKSKSSKDKDKDILSEEKLKLSLDKATKTLPDVLDELSAAAPETPKQEKERMLKIQLAADRLSANAKPAKESRDQEKARVALDRLAAAAPASAADTRRSIPEVLDKLAIVASQLPDPEESEAQRKIRLAVDKLAEEGLSSEDRANAKAQKLREPLDKLAAVAATKEKSPTKGKEEEVDIDVAIGEEDAEKKKKKHSPEKKHSKKKKDTLKKDGLKGDKDLDEAESTSVPDPKLALDKLAESAAVASGKTASPARKEAPNDRVKSALDRIAASPVKEKEREKEKKKSDVKDAFEQLTVEDSPKIVSPKKPATHMPEDSRDALFKGDMLSSKEISLCPIPDSKPESMAGPGSFGIEVETEAQKKERLKQEKAEAERLEKERKKAEKEEKEREKKEKAEREKKQKEAKKLQLQEKADEEKFKESAKKNIKQKGDHVMLEDD